MIRNKEYENKSLFKNKFRSNTQNIELMFNDQIYLNVCL